MRLLFVTPRLPFLPCHDAARLAVSRLLDHLVDRHTVAVVAATRAGDTPAQRAWLAERAARIETVPVGAWRHAWTGRPGAGLLALDALARHVADRFAPDVIHLEGGVLAPLARTVAAPSLLACHEAATLRARDVRRAGESAPRRLAAWMDERAETAWAREWFRSAGACVVDSEEDRQALLEHMPLPHVAVVPGGIDDVTHAYRRRGEPRRLVFTGDLSAPRDVAAARRLATAILPRLRRAMPRVELLVAGAERAADGARALGTLPGVRVAGGLADLRASIWGAAVYVSPLQTGFGRKTRLFEPMALGTPVVASGPTLAGVPYVEPGQHVLVADSDDDFAEAIARLLREPLVANTLARNARTLIERRFTWAAVAERYEALYAGLTPSRAMEVAA
jgi:glycosyltransferase involved in cell wall biosynthesis